MQKGGGGGPTCKKRGVQEPSEEGAHEDSAQARSMKVRGKGAGSIKGGERRIRMTRSTSPHWTGVKSKRKKGSKCLKQEKGR